MEQKKIEELEVCIAHQDQQLQELNDVVTAQWAHIETLQKRLDYVLDRVVRLEDDDEGDDEGLSSIERAALDKPPHY